jgi:hypothetical protein
MTEKSSQEDGISRREFVVATGAAAVVGSALAATGTPASAAAPSNEICRMDAVTLAEKIRTKQLSATEVTEAVLGRMDKLNPVLGEAAAVRCSYLAPEVSSGRDCLRTRTQR